MAVVMDIPSAWEFLAGTKMGDHEQPCSYRQTGGGILCDCRVIDEEYERRKAEK